jgi:hypothetical protein
MLKRSAFAAVLLVAVFIALPAHAAGVGKGRTKIDFKTAIGDSGASSRLFAKLDTASAISSLAESGAKSKNDNLAGYTVNFIIGSATFSGTADEKGKVTTPFSAKLTANGGILQIKASGLNLEQLFPLQTADGSYEVTVPLKVTATKTDAATGAVTETVTLSDQQVTFKYTVKKGQAKGKNF